MSAKSKRNCLTPKRTTPRNQIATRSSQNKHLLFPGSVFMSRATAMKWTEERTTVLCELLLHEVRNGHRLNSGLDTEGRNRVIRLFNEKGVGNVPLTTKCLKDKWDHAKHCSQLLGQWLNKETGLGFDPATGFVTAPPKFFTDAKERTPDGKIKKAISSLQNHTFFCADMWGEILNEIVCSGAERYNCWKDKVEGVKETQNVDIQETGDGLKDPADQEQQEGLGDSEDGNFGKDGNQSVGQRHTRESSLKRNSSSMGGDTGTRKGKRKYRAAQKSPSSSSVFCGLNGMLSEFIATSEEATYDHGIALAAETPGLEFNTPLHFAFGRMIQKKALLHIFIKLRTPEERLQMVQAFVDGLYGP